MPKKIDPFALVHEGETSAREARAKVFGRARKHAQGKDAALAWDVGVARSMNRDTEAKHKKAIEDYNREQEDDALIREGEREHRAKQRAARAERAKAPKGEALSKWAKGGKSTSKPRTPDYGEALNASSRADGASSDAAIRKDATSHATAYKAHADAARVIKARGGDYQTHERRAAAHREKAVAAGWREDDHPRDHVGRFSNK